MDEQELERKIQEKGLTFPRITPEEIDGLIHDEQYVVFPGSQLTACCLTLRNGFTVTGESACASPENFNQQIGEEASRKNAREKIWLIAGYLLKEKLNALKNIEVIAESVYKAYLYTCKKLDWEVKESNKIPYSELSDDSKELDRAAVRAVLARLG